MQNMTIRTLTLTAVLFTVFACAGCKDQREDHTASGANRGGGEGQQKATDPGTEGAEKQEQADDEGEGTPSREEPETDDVPHPAHTHRDQSFRLVVEASFKDVPAGARIIAASARDRRYQKVTRSDHKGLPGAVMVAEDGENLFFVSDPIKGKGDSVSYKGLFAVTRRVGTQGDLDTAKGAPWEGEDGKVEGASTAEALTTLSASMGAEVGTPYDELKATLAKVGTLKREPAGSSDPVAIVGGEAASVHGFIRTLVEIAQLRGVPTRLVQGFHQPEVPGTSQSTHSWADARLPRLSWVPIDPVLNANSEGEGTTNAYLGLLPADRVTMVVGNQVSLPEDGTFPQTTLTGDLAAPFALLDGKRVGTATWTARFEEVQAPKAK